MSKDSHFGKNIDFTIFDCVARFKRGVKGGMALWGARCGRWVPVEGLGAPGAKN